jgi:aminopeptidase-like protein
VVTCVGLDDAFTYKRSKRGNTVADRAAELTLRDIKAAGGVDYRVLDFFPSGSDERQYCSQAFNLPVGSLMRGMYATRPEYHTSLDNRGHISFKSLRETIDAYEAICRAIDNNAVYRSKVTQGEPFLSKYDLYPSKDDPREVRPDVMDTLWLLSLADGKTDLLSIAARSNVPVDRLIEAARRCERAGLIAEC